MNKYERIAKYQKAHIRRVSVKLNINTMLDVIEHLEKQPSMQGYIIDLIRQDIAGKNYASMWEDLRQIVQESGSDHRQEFVVKVKTCCKAIMDTMDEIENKE